MSFAQKANAAQENDPIVITLSTQPSCDIVKQQAAKLAASGQYIYVSAGNLTSTRTDFERYFENYLWEKYAIRTKYLDCSIMPSELCYMSALNSKWKARYGKEFINNERKLLKTEFEKKS